MVLGEDKMPRFFIDNKPKGSEIYIDGEDGKHIARSLRMKIGESITLCDQKGTDYNCEIKEINENTVIAEILFIEENKTEPKTMVHLFQCLPKGDKLDFVVQKVTELGAVSVTPVLSERCVAKLNENNSEKKIMRLQKITAEAAKQSGRGIIPLIHKPVNFKNAVASAAEKGDVIFFYELGGIPLQDLIPNTSNVISVFIGPEGGFSEKEAEIAIESGAKVATLGKRILRTETAAVTAVAVTLFGKGDMQ